MEIEDIQKELQRRFARPLPEYYERHIIFWQDPEGEFKEDIDGIELKDAKILKLTGRNGFEAKKLLTHDDLESNYLVYVPFAYESQEDDWLLDIELYSQPAFRADLLSIWMSEMHVPEFEEYRQLMHKYRKFFQAKERRQKFCALMDGRYTPAAFMLGLMAASVGAADREPGEILRTVLRGGYDMKKNTAYAKLESYALAPVFWQMAYQASGYDEGSDHDLSRLLLHIFIQAASRNLAGKVFEDINPHAVTQQQGTYCYDFVSEWQHGTKEEEFYPVSHYVETTLSVAGRLSKLPVEGMIHLDIFPCVDEVILQKVMQEVIDNLIDAKRIREIVEERRTLSWYARTEAFYDGLLSIADMIEFSREHAMGFHQAKPFDVWKSYTEDYYRMDAAYRSFHVAFARSLGEQKHERLDDLYKLLAEQVENEYANGYLAELAENWTHVCAHDLEKFGFIQEVPKQESFYQSKVRAAQNRIFVIISDGMRYEVAATLAKELEQEIPSEVKLSSCQAIFPAITKFGMAALLPHQELSLKVGESHYAVLADGKSTEAGSPRENLLRAANPNSVVLKAEKIIGSKRAERNEMMKGMEVVYIYHDMIDSTGHSSGSKVFSACREAIDEIKNLVRIIVNDYNSVSICITADHGFLYTYKPLKEDDKVEHGVGKADALDIDRRYVLAKKGAAPAHLMPVKFLQGKTEYEGYVPKETIRLKIKGAAMNYVHGGVSLQEMVVPVVEFKHVRSDSVVYRRHSELFAMQPVELHLLTATRTVSNMSLSLKFYQAKPVGNGWRPATYDICFTDAQGNEISDVQRVIADKTSLDNTERTYGCQFNLKAGDYTHKRGCYLVIRNAENHDIVEKEPMEIEIAFEKGEFDFFS